VSHNAWEEIELELTENRSPEGMIGWAAGLFEGEGCFSMRWSKTRNQNKRYPALTIVSTDRDVLEKFQEVVNMGKIYERRVKSKLGKKKIHVWQVGARDQVFGVCKMLWPYLSDRRRKSIQDGLSECKVRFV